MYTATCRLPLPLINVYVLSCCRNQSAVNVRKITGRQWRGVHSEHVKGVTSRGWQKGGSRKVINCHSVQQRQNYPTTVGKIYRQRKLSCRKSLCFPARILQCPLGLATLGLAIILGLATRNSGFLDNQHMNSTLGLATYIGFSDLNRVNENWSLNPAGHDGLNWCKTKYCWGHIYKLPHFPCSSSLVTSNSHALGFLSH